MKKLLKRSSNLSKTEFIAYIKCPFKFYLLKELNKQTEKSVRKDYSDYESNLAEGIERHHWLQKFFQKFGEDIQNNLYPLLGQSDKNEQWKKQFIDSEIKRYKQQKTFWEPVAVEFFLKNTKYRGQIDRIDQLDDQGNCRIVEYKPYPGEFDEEELLFYTVLISNILPHQDLINIKKVTEIGVYYYFTGQFQKAEVTSENIQAFEIYLNKIRKDMLICQSIKKKEDCVIYSLQIACIEKFAKELT